MPSTSRPATLYELTGRSLDVPLAAFDHWVESNWERIETARRDWDRLVRSGLTQRRRGFVL